MRAWILLASVVLLPHAAEAGKITSTLGCDLSGVFTTCKWEPSSCYKPHRPYSMPGTTVQSYNLAVDEFNAYVAEVARYKECVVDEAKRDVSDGFPDMVVKSVKEEAEDIDRDVRQERSELELSKPR